MAHNKASYFTVSRNESKEELYVQYCQVRVLFAFLPVCPSHFCDFCFVLVGQEYQPWIEATLGRSLGDDLFSSLTTGVVLCELMLKLRPGSVVKYKTDGNAVSSLENVSMFLQAAKGAGIAPHDLFAPSDLLQGLNKLKVVQSFEALKTLDVRFFALPCEF